MGAPISKEEKKKSKVRLTVESLHAKLDKLMKDNPEASKWHVFYSDGPDSASESVAVDVYETCDFNEGGAPALAISGITDLDDEHLI